jgi:hypothetical protein
MSFFDDVKEIVANPAGFFQSVKEDQQMLKPWLFYVQVMGIYYFINVLVSIPLAIQTYGDATGFLASFTLPLYILFNIAILAVVYILVIGGVFIGVGFLHLLFLIVGADKGFVQTLKIVTYSSTAMLFLTPFLILQAIPVVGGLLFSGFAILFGIYTMYLEVQGAKVLHELSTARAVVAVIVIPVVLMLIVIAILALFFPGVLALAMSADPSITGMFV